MVGEASPEDISNYKERRDGQDGDSNDLIVIFSITADKGVERNWTVAHSQS